MDQDPSAVGRPLGALSQRCREGRPVEGPVRGGPRYTLGAVSPRHRPLGIPALVEGAPRGLGHSQDPGTGLGDPTTDCEWPQEAVARGVEPRDADDRTIKHRVVRDAWKKAAERFAKESNGLGADAALFDLLSATTNDDTESSLEHLSV